MKIDLTNSYDEFELLTEVYIPNTVYTITDYMFMGFLSIKDVYVHADFIKFDGVGGFKGCKNIENVYYDGTIEEVTEQKSKLQFTLNL